MAVSCVRQVSGLREKGAWVDVLAFGSGKDDARVVARENGDDVLLPPDEPPGSMANIAWAHVRARHTGRPYTHTAGFGASWSGFVATSFAQWLGVPSLVLVRGNDFDRDWFLPRHGEWLRTALSAASAIGAVAPEKVERIARSFPGRIVKWTPNGIDVSRWALLPADERRREEVRSLLCAPDRVVIGLFGDLKFKKRIPLLLEAIRDLRLLTSIRLLVTGEVDDETSALLDDPAAAPRSIRFPFLAPDELPALYAACDFVALPSAFEGMPNVLLEAMACGAIPIVSDAGASSEIVIDGESGFVFRAEDRASAGRALSAALALDPRQRAALAERTRERVRREFPPEREIAAILDLLDLAAR
jgi:glycosyltransferase involved in cell wall biosynthesis